MIEHVLWEGLSGGGRPESTVESERFVHGQVSLDVEHRGTNPLLLGEHLSTTLIQDGVDTTDGILGTLNLDEVDGLLDTGGGKQAGGVRSTTASGDDLSSSTVDRISVELCRGSE